MCHRLDGEKGEGMPDREEREIRISDILDAEDTALRKARLMPWGKHMEPTPETDGKDESKERGEAK